MARPNCGRTSPPASEAPETRELNENVYLDLDEQGRAVSLIIERARQAAKMEEFSYQMMPASAPAGVAAE